MDKKIFWDTKTGTVYWLHAGTDEVAFAPINSDGTCNLQDGGIVEVWNEIEADHKALIMSKIQ